MDPAVKPTIKDRDFTSASWHLQPSFCWSTEEKTDEDRGKAEATENKDEQKEEEILTKSKDVYWLLGNKGAKFKY